MFPAEDVGREHGNGYTGSIALKGDQHFRWDLPHLHRPSRVSPRVESLAGGRLRKLLRNCVVDEGRVTESQH